MENCNNYAHLTGRQICWFTGARNMCPTSVVIRVSQTLIRTLPTRHVRLAIASAPIWWINAKCGEPQKLSILIILLSSSRSLISVPLLHLPLLRSVLHFERHLKQYLSVRHPSKARYPGSHKLSILFHKPAMRYDQCNIFWNNASPSSIPLSHFLRIYSLRMVASVQSCPRDPFAHSLALPATNI